MKDKLNSVRSKRHKLNFILYLLLLFLAAIYSADYAKKTVNSFIHQSDLIVLEDDSKDQLVSVVYQKDGIKASYPMVVTGASKEDRTAWNDLILDDFNQILQIYSFHPFPELEPHPTAVVPIILELKYNIRNNTDKLLSVFYSAYYNSAFSAHPSDLIYTTNIDKVNNKRLFLSDFINLNLDFVEDFRTWELVIEDKDNQEVLQAIRDYIANMTNDDLLQAFRAADRIGSNNPWGVFSYVTPDRLGISISVPHYAGDHAEFESFLSRLGAYLKPGITW